MIARLHCVLCDHARRETQRPALSSRAANDRVLPTSLYDAGPTRSCARAFGQLGFGRGATCVRGDGLSDYEGRKSGRGILGNHDRHALLERRACWKPGVPVAENEGHIWSARASGTTAFETALVTVLDDKRGRTG